jgi:hypothetical protein
VGKQVVTAAHHAPYPANKDPDRLIAFANVIVAVASPRVLTAE